MDNIFAEHFTKQILDPVGLAIPTGKLTCDLYNKNNHVKNEDSIGSKFE